MAELEGSLRNKASHDEPVSLMPGVGEDDGADITASVAFEFSPGDYVTFSSTHAWFLAVADADAESDATKTPMPAGLSSLTVPQGVGSVAMFSEEANAIGNAWKS